MLKRIHYGEYYPSFINTPGRIKYDFQEEFFTSLQFDDIECPNDWKVELATPETLRRSIPLTRRYFIDYTCLVILKREENDEIWYKIALQNPTNKTVAILTTTNSPDNLRRYGNRPGVKTLDGTWVMARYRTTAPMYFWFEIKKKITMTLPYQINELTNKLGEITLRLEALEQIS